MVMGNDLIHVAEISDVVCLLTFASRPEDGDRENRRPKSILVVCFARVLFDHPRMVAGSASPQYFNLCYVM
jgi:hypothetical protein